MTGAMVITMRAMSAELEADDADAARRTFVAAAPLLAIAERPEIARAAPGARRRACAR